MTVHSSEKEREREREREREKSSETTRRDVDERRAKTSGEPQADRD